MNFILHLHVQDTQIVHIFCLYLIIILSSRLHHRKGNFSSANLGFLPLFCRAVAQFWRIDFEPDMGLQENIICPHRFLLRLHGSARSLVISPSKWLLLRPGQRLVILLPGLGSSMSYGDHFSAARPPGTWSSCWLSVAFSCLNPPWSYCHSTEVHGIN